KMLVNQFLELSAEKHPDKEAVWYQDQWMTFSRIDKQANRIGNYLKERGIRRGDRVALLIENSFDYIIGYYGILKAGAVTVALNTETTVDSLSYLLQNSGARAIFTTKKFSKYLLPALENTSELS
ncbi:MAG: AMP-binding protein, partial [Calditrichia bacterium]